MRIGTHNGMLHPDEVAAISALGVISPGLKVIRTRDVEILAAVDMLVDVGMEFDPASGKFDHHQKGGAGKRPNGIPYASFGLVWKTYGPQICEKVLGRLEDGVDILQVANLVDQVLVQPIDARDCGVRTHYGANGTKPFTVADAVARFNPGTDSDIQEYDLAFEKAIEFFSLVLINEIKFSLGSVLSWNKLLTMIEGQIGQKIIVLEKFVSWNQVVPEVSPETKIVIFKDMDGSYRLQGLGGSLMPKEWHGANKEELRTLTGAPTAIFCHNSGFIMGVGSYEDAIFCANLALKLP